MLISQNVICPNCNHSFHLEEVYFKNIQNEIEEKYKKQNNEKDLELLKAKEQAEKASYNMQEQAAKHQTQLDQVIQNQKNEISNAVQTNEINLRKTFEEEKNISLENEKQKIKNQVETENSDLINRLKNEAQNANIEIQKAKQLELDIIKLKNENANQRIEIELELSKKKEIEIQEAMETVSRREADKTAKALYDKDLALKDKENQLTSIRKELEDARRKAEQGSMQLQGETLELLVENYLKRQFKDDTILPVAKGISGADILHRIIFRDNLCGTIIYEIKRTKSFNKKEWIEKLKQEQINSKADISVLITETMPSEFENEKVIIIEGVWVCHSSSFEVLILALRDSILRIDKEKSNQLNKGDKAMELYDYLISNEFNLQIVAIVDAFTSMKIAIDKEKRAMEKLWKEREIQLEKVTKNTIGIYGTLRGIAGSAIKDVKELELIEDEDEPLQLGF